MYWDDVSFATAGAVPTWGQSFGYDGFGNLFSETPTAGSAPNLSINIDSTTNRVVAPGVQYDAAGNMTNDGTQSYGFDEMNRLSSVGSYLYAYSGNESRRILVYKNLSSPTATFNLYGPDGKRLGWYSFTTSNNWTTVTAQGLGTYQYLGNKPLNYADDRLGSNRSAGTFFPYGNPYSGTNPGAENQTFGTYVQDTGSGLMYADQRYYSPQYGRFMTADRSDDNIHHGNPTSWNRYAYTNGDPVNGIDPNGLDLFCSGGTPDGQGIVNEPYCYNSDPDPNDSSTPTSDPVSTDNLGDPVFSVDVNGQLPQPDPGETNPSTTTDPVFTVTGYIPQLPIGLAPSQPGSPQVPVHGIWHYGHHCGAGGMGIPIDPVDEACGEHDRCFDEAGANWLNMQSEGNWAQLTPLQKLAVQACNQTLCDTVHQIAPTIPQWNQSEGIAAGQIYWFFHNWVPRGARCRQ